MYVHITVTPNSKKEIILQLDENRYAVRIKEPAEHNLANKRVLEIIKDQFPGARNVRIINGHHSRTKLLSID